MNTKKLGVIGGMGSMATATFFNRVVERTRAVSDQEHLNMVISNHATLPDRTQMIASGDGRAFVEAVTSDIHLLEYAAVSAIAMPCNTAHFFLPEMQALTDIPIIDMIGEAVDRVALRFPDAHTQLRDAVHKRVGIVATEGTLASGLYSKACASRGLTAVEPNQEERRRLMALIYAIKGGGVVDTGAFECIVERFIQERGCEAVIIACTELSLIPRSPKIAPHCVDAMDVLVEVSLARCDIPTITFRL